MFYCSKCGADAYLEFRIKTKASSIAGANIYPDVHALVLDINNIKLSSWKLSCSSDCGSKEFYTYCIECDIKIKLSSDVRDYIDYIRSRVGNEVMINGLLCRSCIEKRLKHEDEPPF